MKIVLTNWHCYKDQNTQFIVGIRKYTGDLYRATVKALQGGPYDWIVWTNRGTWKAEGYPKKLW